MQHELTGLQEPHLTLLIHIFRATKLSSSLYLPHRGQVADSRKSPFYCITIKIEVNECIRIVYGQDKHEPLGFGPDSLVIKCHAHRRVFQVHLNRLGDIVRGHSEVLLCKLSIGKKDLIEYQPRMCRSNIPLTWQQEHYLESSKRCFVFLIVYIHRTDFQTNTSPTSDCFAFASADNIVYLTSWLFMNSSRSTGIDSIW